MNRLQTAHPGSSTNPSRRQLLYRYLPIIGTGLLMFWLSGGPFPRTWLLYARTCAQFSQLLTQLGGGFLFAFVVLTVQSLLLALAWGLLLWLAMREAYALFSARQKPIPVAPAAPPLASRGLEALSPAELASVLQGMQYAAQPPVSYAQPKGAPTSRQGMDALVNPFESAAYPLANPAAENPFEEPGPSPAAYRPRGVQRLQGQEETPAVSSPLHDEPLLPILHDGLPVPVYAEEVRPPAILQQH